MAASYVAGLARELDDPMRPTYAITTPRDIHAQHVAIHNPNLTTMQTIHPPLGYLFVNSDFHLDAESPTQDLRSIEEQLPPKRPNFGDSVAPKDETTRVSP
jgi:hypothetical protein